MPVRLFICLLIVMAGISCQTVSESDRIIDKSLKVSGLNKLESAEARFDFRNMYYVYKRDGGQFEYTRIQTDSTGTTIKDVLSNEGLIRYIADTVANITEERRAAYSRSVNSVMYFAFLPLRLNDPSVQKKYMGLKSIKEKIYHQIEITFEQQGGGRDFEDIFYYWFEEEDYSLDYLAYKYYTDGGGIRFRKAYNIRKINGVTIQDYRNFRPLMQGDFIFDSICDAYINGDLALLSTIELENMDIDL